MTTGLLLLSVFLSVLAPTAQTQYREVLLFPDERGRMTAVSIRFPVGASQDSPGQEGAANLLGALIQEGGNARLVASGGEVLVEVGADEFLITLLSPPDRWIEGVTIVESLLYEGGISNTSLEPVRAGIVDILRFEAGSPVRDFENLRSALIRGEGHPASRRPMGSVNTLPLITHGALEIFRMTHLRREGGVVAITGPVSLSEAEAVFRAPVRVMAQEGATILPPIVSAPVGEALPAGTPEDPGVLASVPPSAPRMAIAPMPMRVPAAPASAPAWISGERIETNRELTSTWIAAAYPLPPGSPPLLLEFLSRLVEEALSPTPPDPGLFQLESALIWIDHRPVLVISASVDPRMAGRWESRILGVLPELAASPPTGSFFDLARRRFRSSILLSLASPENRVRWAAREASRTGPDSLSIESDLWRLDMEGVAGAAASASPPRIHIVGPLGMRVP